MLNKGFVPQTLEELERLAKIAISAGYAPRGATVPSAMMAMAKGMESGMGPLMSLQVVGLVSGKPTIYGDGILSLIHASGLLEDIKESIDGEGDTRTATCMMKRRGIESPFVGSFSVADAKKAGLWMRRNKNGKPSPWVLYSDRMLQIRARGFVARDGFADALAGLITVEEARDYPEDVTKGTTTMMPDEEKARDAIGAFVKEEKPLDGLFD